MMRHLIAGFVVLLSASACNKTESGTAPVGAPCTLNGDCQNGLVCLDGRCATIGGGPLRVCTPGSVRCNGGDVEQCMASGEGWDFKTACLGRCSSGACVAQACTANSTRCGSGGHTVEACAADASGFAVVQTCDLGCANGVCTSSGAQICTPSEKRCTSDSIEACTPSGTAWAFLQFCATGCDATTKVCKAPLCVPFTERCSPVSGVHEICSASGMQLTAAPCSGSEACVGGKCVATICTPGQTRCLDSVTQGVCNSGGTEFAAMSCPANQVCNGGSCAPILCAPFSTKCKDGATAQVCAPSGTAYVDVTCPSGSSCSGGNCMPANSNSSCTAGATRCVDAMTLATCNAAGSGYSYATCNASQTCLGATCADVICAPGSTSCASAGSSQVCDPSGTRVNPVPCGAGSACEPTSGQCRPTVCDAASTTCIDAATMGVCNASRTGYTASACGSGMICTGGGCATVVCSPWTASCADATTALVCNGLGTGSTRIDCGAQGKVCTAGACREPGGGAVICVPGSLRCSGSDVEQCKPDGTAYTYVQSCTTTCARGSCASTACAPFTLTAAETALPADNNSTMLVSSGVIEDINGVVVPDGTLFTVAASNNTGGVLSTDRDPVAAGVQVAAVNGRVDFVVKTSPGANAGQSATATATTLTASKCKGTASFMLATAGTTSSFAEDFTRSTYKDAAATGAAWDTNLGQASFPLNVGLGDGEDGPLYVEASTVYNINGNRNPANPRRVFPDAVAYKVASFTGTSGGGNGTGVTLSFFPGGIAVGDEVVLINLQGGGGFPGPTATLSAGVGDTGNVGNYEIFTVASVDLSTSAVEFATPVSKVYGKTNSNADLAGQTVLLQRVPHYSDVNVFGTMTANAWDGSSGGLLFIKAKGTLLVARGGQITMSWRGYRSPQLSWGAGESYPGLGANPGSPRCSGADNNGGGGSSGDGSGCYYGVGGSYGTRGSKATGSSALPFTYGDTTLSRWFMGSAGGSYGGNYGAFNGHGGGILVAWAANIGVAGRVMADGAAASGSSGAGSGGSVYLRATTIGIGQDLVTAIAGTSPGYGAAGGHGRIRIDAQTLSTGSTTAPAYTPGAALASGAKVQFITIDNVAGVITKARIASVVEDRRGGTISYELSSNAGGTWTPFTPGDPLVSFSTAASDLRVRIALTADGSGRPLGVQGLNLEYLAP